MGRQIVWKYYDDGYNPANTVQLTRRLVEQDKVFATVGQLGTEHNPRASAVPEPGRRCRRRSSRRVPRTGGCRARSIPWTIGWQPDYIAEGRLYGSTSRRTTTARRSPCSTRTTTTARTISSASSRLSARRTPTRTSSPKRPSRSTATSVASQMTRIRASGATDPRCLPAPDADDANDRDRQGARVQPRADLHELGVRDQLRHGRHGRCAGAPYVNGIISIAYLKDPTEPEVEQRRGDEAVPHDHGEVRAERECERPGLPVRRRQGGDVRPGALRGRARTRHAQA